MSIICPKCKKPGGIQLFISVAPCVRCEPDGQSKSAAASDLSHWEKLSGFVGRETVHGRTVARDRRRPGPAGGDEGLWYTLSGWQGLASTTDQKGWSRAAHPRDPLFTGDRYSYPFRCYWRD